jgi:uncharacterized membrane protein
MSREQKGLTDEQVEQIVGNLLRLGVITSGIVVCLGGIHYLIQHGLQPVPNYQRFDGVPADLKSPSGIVKDSLTGSSEGLIQLGLLLLIATPVARVLFTIIAFLLQRDYLYTIITLIVFAVLMYSLFWDH